MTTAQSVPGPKPDLQPDVLAAVRRTVRRLLEENPDYQRAPPELRQGLATNMVKVSKRAAELIAEELRLTDQVRARGAPLAVAASAGDQLGLQAARNAGATVKALKDAIDFPSFVTSLISGVFQAITHSSLSQLESLGDLLDNVGKSTDEFTDANVDDAGATTWAIEKFAFLTTGGDGLMLREGEDLEQRAGSLKSALGASDDEISGVDPSDLGGTLLPLVKRRIGRSRQSNLATMVQLGLQRIVVDEGRLHASMELRVDTSSLSEEMKGQRDDMRVNAGASGSFGVGPWGASAKVDTSIGKVSSDTQYTKEQLESRAALRSSVDLAFRTEQIPLDRMADKDARVKLNLAARVPADVEGAGLISATPQLGAPDWGPLPGAPAAAAPAAANPRPAATAPGAHGTPPPATHTAAPTGATPHAAPTAQPPARQPATQAPAAQRPGTQQPARQPPNTQQPATQQPAAQQPATQQPNAPGPGGAGAPRSGLGSAIGSLAGGAGGAAVGAPQAGAAAGGAIGSLIENAFGGAPSQPVARRSAESRQ